LKLSKAVEGFNYSRIADGFSESTLESYKSSLVLVTKFFEDAEIESITPVDLKRFFHYLRTDYVPRHMNKEDTRPLYSAAIHGKWKAIRGLWTWAAEDLGIPNIALAIKMPKHASKEVAPLTEDEIKKLLAACDYTAEAVTGHRRGYKQRRTTALRDKMIVLLLLDTGLRVGELSRINVVDVDLTTRRIEIAPFGQGIKTHGRTVKVGKKTCSLIWRYLSGRGDAMPLSPLLLEHEGYGRLEEGSIKNLVQRLGKRAGLKSCHPHKFRHTFAIQYLRNGGDIFTLQELLGHSSLEMCRRYLQIAQTDIDAAFQKASPVDNWKL
jgi:integrase/recombinase XerD